MKHTKGPWEAFTEPSFSGWWAIRQATEDDINRELGSADGGFDEADARLMAAAPELLEALQMMGGVFHLMGWEGDPAAIKARAAIAKALGEP